MTGFLKSSYLVLFDFHLKTLHSGLHLLIHHNGVDPRIQGHFLWLWKKEKDEPREITQFDPLLTFGSSAVITPNLSCLLLMASLTSAFFSAVDVAWWIFTGLI